MCGHATPPVPPCLTYSLTIHDLPDDLLRRVMAATGRMARWDLALPPPPPLPGALATRPLVKSALTKALRRLPAHPQAVPAACQQTLAALLL